MSAPDISPRVLEFLAQRIDSVPQFEALLLLCQASEKSWRVEEVAARLYVPPEQATAVLRALCLRQLARFDSYSACYRYAPDWDPSGTLMPEIVDAYRRHLVRMTQIIHSSPSAAVRDFARAFDFKRDR